MRIVVCVKWVPVMSALRFDPETRRLVRAGVPGEVSSFDVRALLGALALRAVHGGEVVALTMGPPAAREGLTECLALGADRGVLVADAALAGSDTLATARALAAAIRRESPDLVLLGRASVDAETGQVGPEAAELLGLPQATCVRRLSVDPVARTFTAERETDDGFETLVGPLPALVTAAEDLAEERFPSKAEREAGAAKPITTLALPDLGLPADAVGAAGSPTWVTGVEEVKSTRRGEILTGESPLAIVAALGARLRALGALTAGADEQPPLRERPAGTGAPLWVVAEFDGRGVRNVTRELLAAAAELAVGLAAPVEAVVIGHGREHAEALAHAGADRVLLADDAGLVPYTTDAHAAVLAEAIRARQPRLVLLGSTVLGRDLAPRVAARLGLGLTGDAIGLDLDGEWRIRQHKPAFGGTIVAPILSRTRPEMATVRPGVLPAARPDARRRAVVETLVVPVVRERVRVIAEQPLPGAGGVALDAAQIVIGVGRGVGGPAALPAIERLAAELDAALGATREVTDAGWLPKQLQIGLTGRAIAPRLYIALGIKGTMEHMVGLRRARTIVAVNKAANAPIFKSTDFGIVADYATILPHLGHALR
jgi:electron transfer flavoprotein alpha subunit